MILGNNWILMEDGANEGKKGPESALIKKECILDRERG